MKLLLLITLATCAVAAPSSGANGQADTRIINNSGNNNDNNAVANGNDNIDGNLVNGNGNGHNSNSGNAAKRPPYLLLPLIINNAGNNNNANAIENGDDNIDGNLVNGNDNGNNEASGNIATFIINNSGNGNANNSVQNGNDDVDGNLVNGNGNGDNSNSGNVAKDENNLSTTVAPTPPSKPHLSDLLNKIQALINKISTQLNNVHKVPPDVRAILLPVLSHARQALAKLFRHVKNDVNNNLHAWRTRLSRLLAEVDSIVGKIVEKSATSLGNIITLLRNILNPISEAEIELVPRLLRHVSLSLERLQQK